MCKGAIIMDNIIHKIYRGKLCDMMTGLCETMYPEDKEIDALFEKLRTTLTKEQLKLFDRYVLLSNQSHLKAEEARYTQGFKTGLLIGVECIDGVHKKD